MNGGRGRRIKKRYENASGTTTTEYVYDTFGRLICENISDGKSIIYLYDEAEIVGFIYNTTSIYLFDKNDRGDVLGIIDSSGNSIVTYAYDAWGNCTITSGASLEIAKLNPIRYRSYYYDNCTGLYYFNGRYYNSKWRRFIGPASSSSLDPSTANGLNLYCYASNNPVGIAYSSPSVGRKTTAGLVSSSSISSGTVSSSRVDWENGGFQIPIWISSLMSGSDFGASIAPALRTIYQYIRYPGVKDLNKLYNLDLVPGKLNTVCSAIGYGLLGLNIGLSAWSNFTNDNLTTKQQWISLGVDTAYTLGTFGICYSIGALVSLIPGVGVFTAPFVAAAVTWFIDWTNEKWGWLNDVKQWFNDL